VELIGGARTAMPLNPQVHRRQQRPRLALGARTDARDRDCKKAVESTANPCDLSEWKEVYFRGSLVAAYARVDYFDQVMRWLLKADAL
jgi:hypothetical protein